MKKAITNLIEQVTLVQGSSCPCHAPSRLPPSSPFLSPHHHHHHGGGGCSSLSSSPSLMALGETPSGDDFDYAFEMASSTVRFGRGVTQEVGMDVVNMGAKKVLVMTDKNLATLPTFRVLLDALTREGVDYEVWDETRVEPTDASFHEAINVAKRINPDLFIAFGGGSVMDTTKAANLYATFPENDFLDFVNAPIGKGLPVPGPIRPLIALPTTAGTGSETTGVAIFDYQPLQAKTGIGSRFLRPTIGIIDPNNSETMPPYVATASGFDVLCHALESYTALPYDRRPPRPTDPKYRPAYQGANPMSDIWSLVSLEKLGKYFFRSVEDPEDKEAKEAMLLASTMAGVGFGNAGVHLAHGMSYAISGLNKRPHVQYKHADYPLTPHLVPHGISVCVTSPAIFRTTAHTNPERHMQAAKALGGEYDGRVVDGDSAGEVLKDTLLKYMDRLKVPMGLSEIGYKTDDIPDLVEGTLPQKRVTQLAPDPVNSEYLQKLFEQSMKY